MTSSHKRPWFRFHLLTAVLMMFAAGGFVGANLLAPQWLARNGTQAEKICWDNLNLRTYGWPYDVYSYNIGTGDIIPTADGGYNLFGYYDWDPHWRVQGIVINGAILLFFVALVASVSEYLIRRREGRKS